jgi:phospholipid N-methyltransferase
MDIFVKRFLRHPLSVSTPWRIKPGLAVPMAKSIEGKVVVEFGSADGPITQLLLQYLPHDGVLYCFEKDSELCAELERKIIDPRIRIFNKLAQDMHEYIAAPPNTIVSSIPFQTVGRKIRRQILEVAKTALAETSGLFIPMQYYLPFFGDRPPRLKQVIDRYFSEVQWNPIPVREHFPPAGYYLCRHSRD